MSDDIGNEIRAIAFGTALPLNGACKQSPPFGGVSTIAACDINLTALLREYGIRTIWRDPALDRFHVVLLDYSDGQGGSVGEALEQAMANAERRAA
jgi:hypothetical protein